MCERLLANPVTEDYDIAEIASVDGGSVAAGAGAAS
jgi:hypothetical protein